jgi:hypothetical protein
MTGAPIIGTLTNHPLSSLEAIKDFEQLAQKYPYFGLAQFHLMLAQAGSNKTPDLNAASLYFKNDLLINLRIKEYSNSLNSSILKNTITNSSLKELSTPINENQALNKETDLVFEPLHTTDYFASQGIRLSEQQTGNDRLGKQLKSFTEWLKTMKKVKPEVLADQSESDPAVDQLAEISNKKIEVITEAMAALYIQQGNKALAIDIYTKLSLQNPAKKPYFAEKINHLKSV